MNEPRAPRSIFVAGHAGLVGSALMRRFAHVGTRVITRSRAELDLTNEDAVRAFLGSERPEQVYVAAARVGGILANQELPAEFIHQNLAIQTNLIHESWKAGVKRLLFLGSSCIYPRDCLQPIEEKYLLTGPLEPTNRPYAIAKIAGIEMCWSYNRQYGTRFLCAMPTNLYGPRDNYDLSSSHVLPALIRKFHEAKIRSSESVMVWGTGKPRREFLHVDDLADACTFLMGLPDAQFDALLGRGEPPLVNIGWGKDVSIEELANTIKRIVDFRGSIEWDRSKPDGTPQKLLSTTRMKAIGWSPRITLDEGLRRTYEEFSSAGALTG